MASSSVLSAQQSQVTVNLTSLTVGPTATVTNVALLPRLGQSQLIRINLTVSAAADLELELLLYDEAFEEYGLMGEKKQAGKAKGI